MLQQVALVAAAVQKASGSGLEKYKNELVQEFHVDPLSG